MSARVEFRVVWKRDDRQRSTRIYQSWSSAYRKAQGILALEAVKNETEYDSLPDLEERPTIEQRQVGDWEPAGFEVADPSEGTKTTMRSLYGKVERRDLETEDVGVIPF